MGSHHRSVSTQGRSFRPCAFRVRHAPACWPPRRQDRLRRASVVATFEMTTAHAAASCHGGAHVRVQRSLMPVLSCRPDWHGFFARRARACRCVHTIRQCRHVAALDTECLRVAAPRHASRGCIACSNLKPVVRRYVAQATSAPEHPTAVFVDAMASRGEEDREADTGNAVFELHRQRLRAPWRRTNESHGFDGRASRLELPS